MITLLTILWLLCLFCFAMWGMYRLVVRGDQYGDKDEFHLFMYLCGLCLFLFAAGFAGCEATNKFNKGQSFINEFGTIGIVTDIKTIRTSAHPSHPHYITLYVVKNRENKLMSVNSGKHSAKVGELWELKCDYSGPYSVGLYKKLNKKSL